MEYWKTLKSDDDAVFDKEVRFDAADIEPVSYTHLDVYKRQLLERVEKQM